MIYLDKIEKLHPIVIFSVFLVFISSVIPIFYLNPYYEDKNNISSDELTGIITFVLKDRKIMMEISIESINEQILNLQTILQLNFELRIDPQTIEKFSYNLTIENTLNYPILFNRDFELDESYIFVQKFDLQLKTNIVFPPFVSSSIVSNFVVGRFDHPLYEKWFLITFFGGCGLIFLSFININKRLANSFSEILVLIRKNKWKFFKEFTNKINENEGLILFIIPIFILISIFYQIYLHFFLSFSFSSLFYNSKINAITLFFLYSLFIFIASSGMNEILDRKYGSRLIEKTKLKNNLIFVPIYVLQLTFIYIIITVFPYPYSFIFSVLFSFVINILVYYWSLKFHCFLYQYDIKNSTLIKFSLLYRSIVSIVLGYLINLLIINVTSFPFYYLIF
jgi:hypothetical protein